MSRLSKSPLVQLATLLRAGPTASASAGSSSSFAFGAGGGAGGEAGDGERVSERAETQLVKRCRQVVESMRAKEPAITDWNQYVPSPPYRHWCQLARALPTLPPLVPTGPCPPHPTAIGANWPVLGRVARRHHVETRLHV